MQFYENFNSSNQTSPRFERHENFVTDLKSPGCAVVQTLEFEDRCEFVKKTQECKDAANMFDYTNFFYCVMDPRNVSQELLGIFFYMLVCYELFNCVGTVTDKFFCPPLKIVTKSLGISESLAGVTLLAFGNSAPDIIQNLADITGDVGTIYSDLMGTAVFITAFIAGAIIVLNPVKVEPETFTRDVSFHILAIVYIDYAIKTDKYVNIMEAILILSIYACYFFVIILDQILLVRTLRDLKRKVKRQWMTTDAQRLRLQQLQDEVGIEIVIKPRGIRRSSTVEGVVQETTSNENLFIQFWNSIRPLDMDEWRDGGLCTKFNIILQIPINVVLLPLVPTVSYSLELAGWSKLLNCLQIILLPGVISLLLARDWTVLGFPVPLFTTFITVPICVIVFAITRTDKAPPFHILFGFFSIICSTFLIKIFAKEIVNIIELLGIVTYASKSFLGVTISAWGNEVGDLIANIGLAKQGYQKMGLVSCFAGPLFYITTCTGGTYLYKCLQDENYLFQTTQGAMGENCLIFLSLNLILLLISASTTNFSIRRSNGIFLIFVYALFCLYCLMGELQFIHPFGTDHSEDYGIHYL